MLLSHFIIIILYKIMIIGKFLPIDITKPFIFMVKTLRDTLKDNVTYYTRVNPNDNSKYVKCKPLYIGKDMVVITTLFSDNSIYNTYYGIKSYSLKTKYLKSCDIRLLPCNQKVGNSMEYFYK